MALDTQTLYMLDAVDGWKDSHYLLRWVNPTGQKGAWGVTATMKIGA